MALDHNQKKYIQKNVHKKTLSEICKNLDIDQDEVLSYLKKKWRKDKYEKYLDSQLELEKNDEDLTNEGNSDQKLNRSNRSKTETEHQFQEKGLTVFNFLFTNKAILFLVLLVLGIYIWTLGHQFVSDDIRLILQNQNLKTIEYLFAQPFYSASIFFHWVIANLFGIQTPAPYRLVNILFHTGSVIFIYFIFLRLYSKRLLAFFVAGLFAVHPVLVESVTWISGYSSSQYTFFFFLSFLLYIISDQLDATKKALTIKNKQLKSIHLYIISLITLLIATSSSHRAVSIFLLFPLYELIYGNLKLNLKRWTPVIAIGLVGLAFIFLGIGSRVDYLQAETTYNDQISIPFIQKVTLAITEYFKLIVWPQNLSLYQTELSASGIQYYLRIGILVIFCLILAFLFYQIIRFKINNKSHNPNLLIKKYDYIAYSFFWLSFFLIALVPTLNPFGVSWIVAERYVYMASLGIFALFGLIFYKLSKKEGITLAVLLIYFLLIAILSIRTVVRNTNWKNEDTLWIATLKTSPSGYNIHNNMGDYYARQGDLLSAQNSFQTAVDIKPDYADAYHNLANTQVQIAKQLIDQNASQQEINDYISKAMNNFQSAIQYKPNLWQSYLGLGSLYFDLEDYQKSYDYILKSVELNQSDISLKYNLALVLIKLNRVDEARDILNNLLAQNPLDQNAREMLNQIQTISN